ncbi:hypothetical protein HNP84_008260 [Thermocatellispora tengchongensis]|uniref:Uncharacterized protein n=1 Tax=Thermocatellispora tengchongensis TaxID=1073253 RepID=A0A840PI45_9ACTN|nr:hypothetical protein [Thermocatellispora tengchongensis]MBB5138506.1 hypothetical protein [Thermocatellispora tengchongensis]
MVRVVVTDAEVTLADVLTVRLAMDEPLAEGAELVLRHRTSDAERRVALGGAEARDATLAVSLAPLGLEAGRWDAYLHQAGRKVRLKSVDPGFSLDHLDAYALARRTVAYRAYRTLNGYLALKIDEARPVAEVRAVWFREGRFEVTGLLAYTGLDDDDARHEARLALRRHSPDARLSTRATVRGVRFHAALSLCDVIDAAQESAGTWEPSLEVDGLSAPLPLGAKVDDVDGKRRRVHYPETEIDGVPVRPSYSPDDELRLEVGG